MNTCSAIVPRRDFLLATAGAAAFRWPCLGWPAAPADLILYDGDVHVVDRTFRRVEAIAVWANTPALAAAGITRETVPPPAGVIVKTRQASRPGSSSKAPLAWCDESYRPTRLPNDSEDSRTPPP
jgi:hypothetical protein